MCGTAAKCATPEPQKGTGKGSKGDFGAEGDYKGMQGNKGGGKGSTGGKGDWKGFYSYCGKRGHGPRDCWAKEKDEASNNVRSDLAAIEGMEEQCNSDCEVGGFDVACVDLMHERETTVGRWSLGAHGARSC